MTIDPQGKDESRWIVEPPAPDEVHFQIAVGEGIAVTEETRQAIDKLLNSLQAQETEGFAVTCWPKCPDLKSCGNLLCDPLNNCKVLTQRPCLADMQCQIKKIM